MKRQLYQELASRANAIGNCINSGNTEWQAKHAEAITELVKAHMPHGSGFDSGTEFDLDFAIKHNGAKLRFATAFHHMNDGGYYDGWTNHAVTVTPSLAFRFDLKISGRNRNEIKEYISEIFNQALSVEIEP